MEYLSGAKAPRARDRLCELIDSNLVIGQNIGELLAKLKRSGCEVKFGKHNAVKLPGGKKFIRFNSFDEGYTQAHITERLRGVCDVVPKKKVAEEEVERKTAEYAAAVNKSNAPNLFVDIQAELREGKVRSTVNGRRYST
jgi:hypothetical protein